MWRRVVAMFTALALFVLTTQAVSAECRMPERSTGGAAPLHAHSERANRGVDYAEHHHHSGNQAPSPDHSPNAPHPCAALSTCAVTLSPVEMSQLLGVTDADVQRAEMTPRILTSVAIAPELPPPRA